MHTHKESFSTGVLLTLLSATGISLAGLFGKLGSPDLSLPSLIFWRFFSAFFLCFFLLGTLGRLHHIFSIAHPKSQLARSLLVLCSQYCFYYYIQSHSLLNGTVLLSLGPIFIPMIEWVFLGKKVGKSTLVGLIVSFLGMILVLQPDRNIFTVSSIIGILAGLAQGCSQVIFGLSAKEEQSDVSCFYLFLFGSGMSLIPYLYSTPLEHPPTVSLSTLFFLILGMGIGSVLNQYARGVAYRHGTPSTLSTFLYFSILLGGLWDWLIFGEPPNTLSIIGAGFVILGGLLKIYLRAIILKRKI